MLQVISEKKNSLENIRLIAVAAGKGGVGKSTVAVNLAHALKEQGRRVGLLDADVYGPSLLQMLPEGIEPVEAEDDPERLLPGLTAGIPFISVAHFKEKASIVRAPIANSLMEQFLHTVDWGDIDDLIIDFPPGTGDIQLTLMQKAPLSAAVVVTTPQIVSTLDVGKAIELFQTMEIPVLGIIENMSYFIDQESLKPFGEGGGKLLSEKYRLPLLGQIPIDPEISRAGDEGKAMCHRAIARIGEKLLELLKPLDEPLPTVRQKDAHHLEIELNGVFHPISLHELQKRCPCARCEGEKNSEEGVSLLEFSPVGRYAVRCTFTSGCSQGIYPLLFLKKLARQ